METSRFPLFEGAPEAPLTNTTLPASGSNSSGVHEGAALGLYEGAALGDSDGIFDGAALGDSLSSLD